MAENRLQGRPVTISRTGYTGDLGYEIWMDAADALPVWDAIMAAGNDYGIVPCGILAMDMARVEAGLFMLDVDYTAANHAWIAAQKSSPYEMGLGWTVNLDKPGYFVGRRALEREHRDGSAWKLVGFEVDWEGLERVYAECRPAAADSRHGRARQPAGQARRAAGRLRLDQHLVAGAEEIHRAGAPRAARTTSPARASTSRSPSSTSGEMRRARWSPCRSTSRRGNESERRQLRRDRHRRRPQRPDRRGLPRPRRQEGRRARTKRPSSAAPASPGKYSPATGSRNSPTS